MTVRLAGAKPAASTVRVNLPRLCVAFLVGLGRGLRSALAGQRDRRSDDEAARLVGHRTANRNPGLGEDTRHDPAEDEQKEERDPR